MVIVCNVVHMQNFIPKLTELHKRIFYISAIIQCGKHSFHKTMGIELATDIYAVRQWFSSLIHRPVGAISAQDIGNNLHP